MNHGIKTANEYSENMTKFRYLVTTLINENCIHDAICKKINSESSWCTNWF